jgi:aminoglycoside 3-N-acetyltransferase
MGLARIRSIGPGVRSAEYAAAVSVAAVDHVRFDDVRAGARALRLAGRPVCLHASLRSFGIVEGGADAVLDGFLAEGCTVTVPSFSAGYGIPGYSIPPPMHLRPKRNGTDYWRFSERMGGIGRIYTPDTNDIEPGLGAVPRAVVRRAGRVRGAHALNSFAAIGPLAQVLIADQQRGDVYAPLARLGKLGGWVVLLGVGLTSMTLLHLAECLAGRRRFVRWANDVDGQPAAWDTGSCSDGFDRFEPVLAPLIRETFVGSSRWRAFPARETAVVAAAAIRADPEITRCSDPTCLRYPDAIAGGPVDGISGGSPSPETL